MSSNLHEVAKTAASVDAGTINEAMRKAADAHRTRALDARIADYRRVLLQCSADSLVRYARKHGFNVGLSIDELVDAIARCEATSELEALANRSVL